MTRFTPCWVKRVSSLFPCLGLTINCSDFYFVWQMVPFIFNVLIDMFKIFFVYISRKNNQKKQNMTRFTPHHPNYLATNPYHITRYVLCLYCINFAISCCWFVFSITLNFHNINTLINLTSSIYNTYIPPVYTKLRSPQTSPIPKSARISLSVPSMALAKKGLSPAIMTAWQGTEKPPPDSTV